MTWHHVAIIIAAMGFVAYCGTNPHCAAVMHDMSTLATIAISGVLGNALARYKGRRSAMRRRSNHKGNNE